MLEKTVSNLTKKNGDLSTQKDQTGRNHENEGQYWESLYISDNKTLIYSLYLVLSLTY